MEWLKTLLYGEKVRYNSVYYQPKPPNPKRGWLKKSALITGDLWYDTLNGNTTYVWRSDGVWERVRSN